MLSRSVHLGYVFQPAAVNLTEAGSTLGDYFLGDMLSFCQRELHGSCLILSSERFGFFLCLLRDYGRDQY